MKIRYIFSMLFCLAFLACENKAKKPEKKNEMVTARIAFGSCAHHNKAQPMLNVASDLKPDVFIYLGDNIYGDSRNMDTLKYKYNQLKAKPAFQKLRKQTKIYATWDDHDFGENDAGRYYPMKAESKAIFLDFWEVSKQSDRRKHEGIYGVEYLEKEGLKIQIILLDTRTFRDNLIHREPADSILFKNDYIPNESPDSTFLGATQWTWLAEQLSVPADFRIIASSNQFSHEYNGWESWTNVPHEQQKMIDLIKKTKANGVFFISGDVHWGEISKMEVADAYPIYDVTSSGITQTWDIIEPNKNRIGQAIAQNNIGLLELKTDGEKIMVEAALIDSTATKVAKHLIAMEALSFKK